VTDYASCGSAAPAGKIKSQVKSNIASPSGRGAGWWSSPAPRLRRLFGRCNVKHKAPSAVLLRSDAEPH